MERIEQKEDNDIGVGVLGDGLFIGELHPSEYYKYNLRNIIPIEKSSIPQLIKALKKYSE